MTIKEEMVDIILENVKPKMVNYARLQNFNIITVRGRIIMPKAPNNLAPRNIAAIVTIAGNPT